MNEVKELDNKWESIKTAKANLQSLNGNPEVKNLESETEIIESGTVIGDNKMPKVDKSQTYVNAWAKHMMGQNRSEEHTSELQSRGHLVCRLLLEKKKAR